MIQKRALDTSLPRDIGAAPTTSTLDRPNTIRPAGRLDRVRRSQIGLLGAALIFRGGFVFKAHRLLYHSNSRLESNKKEERAPIFLLDEQSLMGTAPICTAHSAINPQLSAGRRRPSGRSRPHQSVFKCQVEAAMSVHENNFLESPGDRLRCLV